MLSYFQLTTFTMMISLADEPHLEIIFQNAMTSARLKHVTKAVTRHSTHERSQLVEVVSSIPLPLSGGVALVVFT